MRRWWCKKYNAPPTDPRYLAYTVEELWVEYLEDVYEKNPAALRDLDMQEDVVLQTGDPEIDEIERRLAAGEDPEVVFASWGNKTPKSPDGLVDSGVAEEDINDFYESLDDEPTDDETSRPTKWSPTRPE